MIVDGNDTGDRLVTIAREQTDVMIWTCTVEHGQGRARAECVLDAVRRMCLDHPVPGWPVGNCIDATNHSHWVDMSRAIEAVVAPGDQCLAYLYLPFYPFYELWQTAPDLQRKIKCHG